MSDSDSSRCCRSSGTSSMVLTSFCKLHADRPVQLLGLRALLERQVTGREQVDRHVERLLRVVIALERVLVVRPAWVSIRSTSGCSISAVAVCSTSSLSKPDEPSTLNTSRL